MLLLIILSTYDAECHSDNFFGDFFATFINLSYDQSKVFDSEIGLNKFSLGLKNTKYNRGLSKDSSFYFGEIWSLGFLNFSIASKSYENNLPAKSNTDYCVGRVIMGGWDNNWIYSMDAAVIEQNNKIYTIKDFNWGGGKFMFGYDFFKFKNGFYIYPAIHCGVEERSFQFDTIAFPMLKDVDTKKQNSTLSGAYSLNIKYKTFNCRYEAGGTLFTSGSEKYTDIIVKYDYPYYSTFLASIYINYSDKKIQINKDEYITGDKLIIPMKTLNIGISVNPLVFLPK